MRSLPLLLLLTAACSGGGGGRSAPAAILAVTGTLDPAAGTSFTVHGQSFPGAVGEPVSLRFTATIGTPFDGCRSATVDATARIVSATELSGTSPTTELAGDVDCTLQATFANGTVLTNASSLVMRGRADASYDQDLDGIHDRCDGDTFDFEDDLLGAHPVGAKTVDGASSGLVVASVGSERVARFASSVGESVSEVLTRLEADYTHQDLTAYIDFASTARSAYVEFWSDGSYAGDAGAALVLRVMDSGELRFVERVQRVLVETTGPMLPASGRVRVRLRKGPDDTSTFRVDAWAAGAWTNDYAVFSVADDTWFTGRSVTLVEFGAETRGIKRISVERVADEGALTLAASAQGCASWKLFQRDANERATIPLPFLYRAGARARVEARVVYAGSVVPVPGHDWGVHALELAKSSPLAESTPPVSPRPLARGELRVVGVPTGGNYDVEVRLVDVESGAILDQDALSEVAVGDVYLALGQSNMSGYSHNLFGATTSIPEVHLFHNSDAWMQAAEPMDDGTRQRDRVSSESPLHSPMLPFGVALYNATDVPVGIIPAPLGGSALYSDWQRFDADPNHAGTLYGSALRRAALQDGEPIRGVLWFQGESDAVAERSTDEYRADLERLIQQMRADLGAPDAVFLCVQLGTWDGGGFPHWTNVQEAQRQVCAADPRAALVTCHDLEREDSLHFDVAGYQAVGQRLAAQAEALVFGDASDPITALERVSVGGARSLVLEYDANVSGGQPSLFEVVDAAGVNAVLGTSASGATVTLDLERDLVGMAQVRYGMSVTPSVDWVRCANGVPVPAFADVHAF